MTQFVCKRFLFITLINFIVVSSINSYINNSFLTPPGFTEITAEPWEDISSRFYDGSITVDVFVKEYLNELCRKYPQFKTALINIFRYDLEKKFILAGDVYRMLTYLEKDPKGNNFNILYRIPDYMTEEELYILISEDQEAIRGLGDKLFLKAKKHMQNALRNSGYFKGEDFRFRSFDDIGVDNSLSQCLISIVLIMYQKLAIDESNLARLLCKSIFLARREGGSGGNASFQFGIECFTGNSFQTISSMAHEIWHNVTDGYIKTDYNELPGQSGISEILSYMAGLTILELIDETEQYTKRQIDLYREKFTPLDDKAYLVTGHTDSHFTAIEQLQKLVNAFKLANINIRWSEILIQSMKILITMGKSDAHKDSSLEHFCELVKIRVLSFQAKRNSRPRRWFGRIFRQSL